MCLGRPLYPHVWWTYTMHLYKLSIFFMWSQKEKFNSWYTVTVQGTDPELLNISPENVLRWLTTVFVDDHLVLMISFLSKKRCFNVRRMATDQLHYFYRTLWIVHRLKAWACEKGSPRARRNIVTRTLYRCFKTFPYNAPVTVWRRLRCCTEKYMQLFSENENRHVVKKEM